MNKLRFAQAAVVITALLTACTPQLRETTPASVAREALESFPHSAYEKAIAQGKPVYRIAPSLSLVAITVRRGGALARFGHDHVVASHNVEGYISPQEGRADIYVALNNLTIDEPSLRAEAGLDTQPSASDIAGTGANMHNKVLDTQKYPYALIRINGINKGQTSIQLSVEITLHGVTRTFETLAQIESDDKQMNVSGLLEFNQSDFGIVPFSIFGGALRVQDHLNLRFKICANRS